MEFIMIKNIFKKTRCLLLLLCLLGFSGKGFAMITPEEIPAQDSALFKKI
jgi:hypothetical protein